ncbi:GGDEF domain-containing protein [Marinobacter fonticola]|uniref:GGDEF domain-containing protein n=1 Tax=Marinobacter fonticola TaxID=2603215 RepID=UPI0011E75E9F|nr:GGDEF domain-containing protein [Marinobacter fonticola]
MDNTPETRHKLAQPHRKAVLVALLWLTAVCGVLFAVLNILNDNIPLAAVELGMVAYSIFLMLKVRHTKHLQRWICAFSLPFFSTMMFAMSTDRTSITVFGWVLLVPLLSHLLHGRRVGLAIAVVFIVGAGSIFLMKYHDSVELMQPVPITNMVILTLCLLVFSNVYEVSRERTALKLLHLARTDVLTGLANRAMLQERYAQEEARARREKRPLAVIVLDLDHFKDVNDRYGHDVGDEALIHVANLLRQRLRATDLACRLGGEEFGALLPSTSSHHALALCETLRATLEANPLRLGDITIPLTMSLGTAELGTDGHSLRTLVARADQRLYVAKTRGRNQVVGPEVTDVVEAVTTAS